MRHPCTFMPPTLSITWPHALKNVSCGAAACRRIYDYSVTQSQNPACLRLWPAFVCRLRGLDSRRRVYGSHIHPMSPYQDSHPYLHYSHKQLRPARASLRQSYSHLESLPRRCQRMQATHKAAQPRARTGAKILLFSTASESRTRCLHVRHPSRTAHGAVVIPCRTMAHLRARYNMVCA